MARRSLRSQLNVIRTWVRQGRTDAWIAHQLEISAAELSEFKRQHDLAGDGEAAAETDLRDEIEAEVEAASVLEAEETERREAEEAERREAEDEAAEESRTPDDDSEPEAEPEAEEPDREGAPRRRRRRGGRGRGRGKAAAGPYEASFDHGVDDGYGLWLDPAVQNDPVYSEHWAGHRPVKVTIEAERIVIERVEGDGG